MQPVSSSTWKWASIVALACVAVLDVWSPTAFAQTSGTWTSATGGTWSNTANWSGGVVAGGTGALADFSTLNITGTQMATLDAPSTLGSLSFADTTTSSTGSWLISNGGNSSNTLTLNAGSGTTPKITVSGMGSGNATISARLLGTSGLILNDTNTPNPGTLVLSGSNGFTGNVTVNSGTLAFQNVGTTGVAYSGWTSGTLTLNAAGLSISTGVATAFPRPIVLGAGTSTIVNQGAAQNEITGVISGAGALNFGSSTAGVGLGANTFSGGATVSAGASLLLRAAGAGASNSPTNGVLGTGTVTLAGGGLRQYNGSTSTIFNVVNVTADTAIGAGGLASDTTIFAGTMTLVGGTRTFTVAGSNMAYRGPGIGDGGNGYGLVKAGTGTLFLGGSNSYSGATTLSSGTVMLENQNALRNSTLTHNGSGALLFSSTVVANAFSFGGLASSSTAATLTLSNTAGTAITLTVGGNNANTTYAGVLAGGGSMVKSGAGMLALSGSNSYAGTTTVSGGVLSVSSSNALPGWGTAGRVSVGADGSLAVGNDMTLQQAIDAGYLAATSGVGFDTTAGNRTVGDAIPGSRPFVKTGGNTLTLTGENTPSPATTVFGGTLQIGNGGTTGSITGGVTLANSSGIAFNRSDSLTYAASISGTGSFTKLGAGTLTLAGSNSYSGATTLGGGVLALGSATSLPASGNITFTGGSLQYTAANTTDLSSRIVSSTSAIGIDTNNQNVTWAGSLVSTNTGGLSKTGAGTLTLSGSNAFTGTVSVTGGTLAIGGPNAFPQTGVTGVSLNGGALQGSGSIAASNIPGVATITLGASGAAIINSLPGNTQWYIYAPIVGGAGTGPLSFSGTSGEFVLGSSSSSYSGGTILSNPQVAIGADSSLGTGTITFAGGGLRATSTGARSLANPVIISGGASFYGSNRDMTLAGPITLTGATQTVTVTGTSVNSFDGSVGDGGAGLGLVKSGTGILVLGGANTYTGTTTFAAGTLRLANTAALAGGGNLAFTGGTLQYSGSNQADYSAKIVGSSAAIAIDTNGQSVSFASALAASNAGGLRKSGSGTLTLAADNAFTGLTTVSGGTLQVGHGGTAGAITGNVTLSSTSGLVFNRSDSFGYAGSISGTGSITKLGAGTLSLSGNNVITGVTTIVGGTLSITGTGALPGTFTLDGGTLVNATGTSSFGKGLGAFAVGPGGGALRSDSRIDPGGVISGTSATALLTYGPATTGSTGIFLVISGSNTYAANTKVEAGMAVVVDNNNAFGTGTLDLAGAAIRSRSSTPRSLANAVTISAHTQFFGAATEPNLTFTGPALLSGGSRTLQVDSVITSGSSVGQPGVIFTNTIGDGGNGYGLTKTGSGVLALGGANAYSGATTLNSGTLQLQNQAALQHSTLALSGTGGVIFDAVVTGNAFTIGGLAASNASATLALQNSAATAIALTVGGNHAATTYAGTLTGAGSLVKTGLGTLTLGGANTYAGTTTVAAGTLLVNGNQSAAVGGLTVDAVAVLGGSGTIGGAVTVNGILSPGNSPGELTVASLVLGGSSTALFEIDGTTRGTQYDGITITGATGPTYGGTLTLAFGNGSAFADDTTFDLFSFAGSPSGAFSAVASSGFYAGTWTNNNDGTFKIEQGGQTLTFSQSTGDIVVVPEPGALVLAGIGIAAAAWACRRR